MLTHCPASPACPVPQGLCQHLLALLGACLCTRSSCQPRAALCLLFCLLPSWWLGTCMPSTTLCPCLRTPLYLLPRCAPSNSSSPRAPAAPGNRGLFWQLQGVPQPGLSPVGQSRLQQPPVPGPISLGPRAAGAAVLGLGPGSPGAPGSSRLSERCLRLGAWERGQPMGAGLVSEEQQGGPDLFVPSAPTESCWAGRGALHVATLGMRWEVGTEVPEGSGNSQVSLVAPGFVRLVGGDSPCSGSVEVYDRDQWKAVCDSHFGAKAAEVVCRELQCGTALSVHGAAHLGEGAGPVWDRELQCVGNESTILFCPWGAPRDQPCTHGNGTHVTCTRFRLVNGSTACAGRVEVEVLGTWGTLCASRWDLSDAHVLCRHLGCGFAESIPGGGHFGRGTGPVWRDSFHCDGTEAHLGQCPVTALGASQCSHENAAAVICSGPARPMSLRLVGGGSRCDGRVEVFQHGTWGRVLDEQWDMQEASVVCRQLQCGEAEAAYTPVRAERGLGPVGLHGVRCTGHEADLSLCNTSLPESPPSAGIMEDVGAVCRGSRRVRLADGAGRCAGRVEIYYQGRWGTVCDDAWDLADAAVVCRQLGCGGALEAAGSARFGEGSGQIWLDGVNCSGAEAALWDCPAEAWGQHDCGHKEDVGVVCSEFMALRLENSDGCSGRLQVFYNGTWGSVCSNLMNTKTVSLVCKELGCGNEGSLETISNDAKLSGTAWLDHVECGKSNSSFWQCPSTPWHPQSCDDLRDEAHITCNERPQVAACPNSTRCTDREKIRTVGGEDGCSGRVEVWHRGAWGTLCDNAWDMRDAEVACRQLGCGPAVYALGQAAFGEGTGPIWLMECGGTELSLQDCWAQPGDSGACQHKADAAVHCSGEQWGWETSLGAWQGAGLGVCPAGSWHGPIAGPSKGVPADSEAGGGWGEASVGLDVPAHPLGCLHCPVSGPEQWCWALSLPPCPAPQEGQFRWHMLGPSAREAAWYRSPSLSARLSFCCPAAAPRTATPPPQADPPRGPLTTNSDRLLVPVIICIILGALLCLLLALLAGQVRSARAQRRGSVRAGEPFSEAVYEEIAYSLAWEKQPRFSLSDVPVLPGGDPADGYDDAGEVSDPGEDPVPGQGDWDVPGIPEEGEGPRDAATGGSLHSQRSTGAPGAEGDTSSPFPGSMGYDDAEEVSLACPHEDTQDVSPEPHAQGSQNPRPAEPSPAEQLGAARREESSVPLGEP
nr:scavenger receptor cysteine-rich domain-containing protein SCART1-like isoform X2 [Anser cygnoides]